jgi:hypothetical protein
MATGITVSDKNISRIASSNQPVEILMSDLRNYLTATITSTSLAFSANALAADPCVKLASAEGATCQEIKVKIDTSACGDDPGVHEAKISCKKNGDAIARIWSSKSIYKVTLTSADGGWGKKTWAPNSAGFLVSDKALSPAKVKAKKTVASMAGDTESAAKIREPAHVISQPKESARESAPVEAPAVTKSTAISPLPDTTVQGYLDFYYAYNFNRPPKKSTPSSNGTAAMQPPNNDYRYYDLYHNQMSLSLAEITIKHTKDDVSMLADLDFGSFADYNAQLSDVNGTALGTDEVSKHIGQANITYSPSMFKRVSFTVGKMYTHMGLETAKAKDNWQYSRSFIYSLGIPVWHNGASASFAVIPDQLTTSLYVYNGWNSMNDGNDSKTLGAQIKWTPNANFNLFYNFIGGPETAQEASMKVIHELNSSWVINPNFSLAADGILGNSDNTVVAGQTIRAQWGGVSLAAKYQPNSWYSISPRIEYLRDQQGYLFGDGVDQCVKSYTLTNSFYLTEGFESRFEVRHDSSSIERFNSQYGNLKPTQTTAEVAVMYSF